MQWYLACIDNCSYHIFLGILQAILLRACFLVELVIILYELF